MYCTDVIATINENVIDIRYKHGDESNYEQIIIQKTTRYN